MDDPAPQSPQTPPGAPVSFFGGNGHGTSLLLAEAAQAATQPLLDLDLGIAEERLARSEHGMSTGERFLRDRPDDYRQIVALLARPSVSFRRIARVYGCGQSTVRAIADREGITVGAIRLRLRDACTAGALGLAERIADDPEAFPKSSLPIALDVLTRNALLLDGQATSIVEHREALSIEDFNAYIESLTKKNGGLETDQSGENSAAMRPPAAPARPALPSAGPLIEVEVVPAEADVVPVAVPSRPRDVPSRSSVKEAPEPPAAEPRNWPE